MANSADDRSSPRTLETVSRTFEVVQALRTLGEAGVTELADHLGISKGTTHCHLSTLLEHGYVMKANGRYRLGFRFIETAEHIKRNDIPMYDSAKQELTKLAHETGEYTHLMVEDDGKGVFVLKLGGEDAIGSDYYAGEPHPLHYLGAGKAILAHLPEDEVEEVIGGDLVAMTENTITDPGELREELAAIRERGYAVSDEEAAVGIRAVGVPILNRKGTLLGSISLSGPVSRIRGDVFEEDIPEKLLRVANIVEINSNYH